MYISMERNNRGALDIEQYALNKLVQFTVNNTLTKDVKDIFVTTELYHESLIYVLVKLTLPEGVNKLDVDEKKINKAVEDVISLTLNMKPKNIAIAYAR